MPWIKWDTRGLRDAKMVELKDGAFRLWIATLSEAWHQTPKGSFENERQYRACVSGIADAKHLKQLLTLGLMVIDDGGSVRVANWEKHQIDPTAGARKERWKNASGTQLERSENAIDKNRLDKEKKLFINTNRKSAGPVSVSDIIRVAGVANDKR
jgi:hypothetical protein